MMATRNGAPSTNGTALPILAPGTLVKAADRDNYGTVILDNGKTTRVHFESPGGHTADVDLPRASLTVVGKAAKPRAGTSWTRAPDAPPKSPGIDPWTAWQAARLIGGHGLEGQPSGPFADILVEIAALPVELRQDALEDLLEGHPNAEAIIKAIFEADPGGPAPQPPMNDRTAWIVRRLLEGETFDMEMIQEAQEPYWPLIRALHPVRRGDRFGVLVKYLEAKPDATAIHCAVMRADPTKPMPAHAEPGEEFYPACLDDLRTVDDESFWTWKEFIPSGSLAGIAANEGVGKTRLAMDLARRIWLCLPWPDGQPPTFPERTPTLWVCADGQQDELAGIAKAMGLPGEAIYFNTPRDEPYAGTEIDASEDLERLVAAIERVKPGLVFIDTLTNATALDLCRATDSKAALTPLRDIAQKTETPVIVLMHLSKEGQALGRRAIGLTRTLIHLDRPNPEQPERLKMWIDKSFTKKPPALGVTMSDAGSEYDFNPPTAPAPGKPGRPSDKRDKAARFLRDALARDNDRIGNELAAEWEAAGECARTFWRAVDEMEEAGELTKDGGKGTGKQTVLHLIQIEPEADPAGPS